MSEDVKQFKGTISEVFGEHLLVFPGKVETHFVTNEESGGILVVINQTKGAPELGKKVVFAFANPETLLALSLTLAESAKLFIQELEKMNDAASKPTSGSDSNGQHGTSETDKP